MIFFLAVLLVGALTGYLVADSLDSTEDDPVGNTLNVINNVTARVAITNDAECTSQAITSQNISFKCGSLPAKPEEYCKGVPSQDQLECRREYNNLVEINGEFQIALKNSIPCVNATKYCGCEESKTQEACYANCSDIARLACFSCVLTNVTQSNFTEAMVSQCTQSAINAAVIENQVKTTSKQTNLIVADAFTAILGNKLASNIADITTNIFNDFKFETSLKCSVNANSTQGIDVTFANGGAADGLSQTSTVVIGTKCMQNAQNYVSSTTEIVTDIDQFIDQEFKGPLSFLTDIFGILTSVGGIIALIIVLVMVGLMAASKKTKDALTGKYKANKKLVITLVVFIIIVVIMVTIIIVRAVESSKNEISSFVPLPVEISFLSTTAFGVPEDFYVYAPGPLLIAMQLKTVENLVGADDTTVNKLASQSLGLFLLRQNDTDGHLPYRPKETYSGKLFRPITRTVQNTKAVTRTYVSTKNTVTQIADVLPGQFGNATYINLTTQPDDIATVYFEPVSSDTPDAVYIYQLTNTEIPVRKYFQMELRQINEQMPDVVEGVLKTNKTLIDNTEGVEYPTASELAEYRKKAAKANVPYGFLDWLEVAEPQKRTIWTVHTTARPVGAVQQLNQQTAAI